MAVTVREMLKPVLECKFLAEMEWEKIKQLVVFVFLLIPLITALQLWGTWEEATAFTPKAIIGFFMARFDLHRREVITFLSLPVLQLLWNRGNTLLVSLDII